MATINPPAVTPGDDTEATWANKVIDHVVATFATVAERDQQIPSPDPGRTVYLESTKQLEAWDGAAWVKVGEGVYLPLTGGTLTGALTLDIGGFAAVMTTRLGERLSAQIGGASVFEVDARQAFIGDGDQTRPGIAFLAEGGLGVRRQGGNTGALVSDGADTMWWNKSGTYFRALSPTGDNANAFLDASGRIHKSTSARKYKKHITHAPQLADLKLEPVTFHRDDDAKDFIGFIADDLAAQDDRIGVYDGDGEIDNYDTRAVMAILAAKVNRLEAQVAALTA